jgi:tripartite-type tricarboxylate transporter receptor subunit TctC
MTVLTNVFNTTLYTNLKFNFGSDIAHVAGVANAPYVVVVSPTVPARTIPEFIAYAKANPGKINMASGGTGSSSHIFGELFKTMAGVDLFTSRIAATTCPICWPGRYSSPSIRSRRHLSSVRTGKLTALAVTTTHRLAALPDLPTVAEAVPGYEALGWYALGAPKNTPAEIVDKLNAATNAALADPKLVARLADLGVEPMPMTPAKFARSSPARPTSGPR